MSQSRGGGRSRIVIDVSQAQAEAEARRRGRGGNRRRLLSTAALVVAGLLLLALVGGYFWWRSFQQGPSYGLALLLDAARREDVQAVEQLVDSEQVAQGFVPQVIERLTGAGTTLPPEARAQVSAALPQLIPRVRETMREEITGALKRFADGAAGSTPTPLLALGISRVAEVERQGDEARVTLRREEKTTELVMRRAGGLWRVTNVRDEELASGIAARLAASIPPAAPQQQNGPRRRQGR